jgi:hypothetical protein
MQTLLEAVLVLVLLLLVFRVSLTRRRHAIQLRGGLQALNILAGLLGAALIACLLRDALRRSGGVPAEPLAAAIVHLMPFTFAVLGGLAGFLLLGALWRRLFQNGPASARTWLRRAEFAIAIGAGLGLLARLLR